jgi:hypothetical protein
MWGGTRDVVKNKCGNSLWQIKDFVTRQNQANFIVVVVPHRHDLQENSSVKSAVTIFTTKLTKCSNAFENLHLLEVDKCREL